jgi:hypothetical protein
MQLFQRPRKLVFSRKGFDSGSGGGPSPIVNGEPLSLPIPAYGGPSATTFAALGLAEHIERFGRFARPPVQAGDFCHHDPFFDDGKWAFGQEGAAQSHLAKQGVSFGDVFLFFGLFEGDGQRRHHRIFGVMQIEEILHPHLCRPPPWAKQHPHFLTNDQYRWKPNNTVYVGVGSRAQRATKSLCLTAEASMRPSLWEVPAWLKCGNLTYHGNANRWCGNLLQTVGRGQEFVSDISKNPSAQKWLNQKIMEVSGQV